MAGEPHDDDDDLIVDENNTDIEDQADEDGDTDDEAGDDDTDGEGDDHQSGDDDDGEGVSIGFADEDDAPGDDNSTIRTMRAELKALRRQLAERPAQQAPTIEVGEKPTLEGCDYDEDRFEKELVDWTERKREADAQQTAAADTSRRANEEWQRDVQAYQTRKASLGVTDFDDAEVVVQGKLTAVQQAVVVKAAKDPAALIYALSKSAPNLGELAKIEDPIKLAAAVARMEGAVKVVTSKRKAPAPDRPAKGSAAMPGGTDKELARLEKEADRTGNRTKLVAYKREKGLI